MNKLLILLTVLSFVSISLFEGAVMLVLFYLAVVYIRRREIPKGLGILPWHFSSPFLLEP
ncbi:MAG: hypothetical protein ACK4OF_03685 [Aquificaceae bacterium]